jgi:starch-binding outer membrane protein, SusD/RagB family
MLVSNKHHYKIDIMKKISLYIIISLAICFSSCKKQLDIKPTDQIEETKAFSTIEDLQKGLLGAYGTNSTVNRIYIGSILADEAKISNENRGQGQFTFKWQYSSAEAEQNSDYALYYLMIDRVHRVLAAMDGVPATTPEEENAKKKIVAELTGLRGIAFYELLIRFMPEGYDPNATGVAIVLESSINAKPSRNTVGEVVEQIKADLATARSESLIPNAPDDNLMLSQAALAAYQARVALLTRDWTNAVNYATEAITLSGKTLATPDVLIDYWGDYIDVETIWNYRNNTAPQLLWRDSNGDVFFEPSDKLKNTFDRDNDARYFAFFSSDGADTSIVYKYPGSSLGPQTNDLKLIRVAEMYLIRAEANAENDQLSAAADDINLLRRNRIYGYADVTFGSKDAAIDAIMNERFKELCYEGFRFFDLKRRSMDIQRDPSDVQSTDWLSLPGSDYRIALPIPQDEIFANPNIIQNPGY